MIPQICIIQQGCFNYNIKFSFSVALATFRGLSSHIWLVPLNWSSHTEQVHHPGQFFAVHSTALFNSWISDHILSSLHQMSVPRNPAFLGADNTPFPSPQLPY